MTSMEQVTQVSSELLKINNINKNELSHEELSHHQPRMHGKNVVNPD